MAQQDDYLTRLVAKTARDDAALLDRFGPIRVSDADSAELLRALLDRWPFGHFDELNVAVDAPYDRRLRRALAPIVGRVRTRKDWGGGRLSDANKRDVLRWLLAVEGRPLDGLVLARDAIGWCDIEPVGGFRQ